MGLGWGRSQCRGREHLRKDADKIKTTEVQVLGQARCPSYGEAWIFWRRAAPWQTRQSTPKCSDPNYVGATASRSAISALNSNFCTGMLRPRCTMQPTNAQARHRLSPIQNPKSIRPCSYSLSPESLSCNLVRFLRIFFVCGWASPKALVLISKARW